MYQAQQLREMRQQSQKVASNALERFFQPSARVMELLKRTDVAKPTFTGDFACVFASVEEPEVRPNVGQCSMPTQHSGPVDRFEADLRYGNFVLRQTDLYVSDVFNVPLTRTYNSGDYIHPNRAHAFGKNTNHPYDISPLGTRNPYSYNLIALEDGDFLFFNRVSGGVGFADALFQHTETSTRFYKAVTAWNGNGWTTFLTDGSAIVFPEAYSSTNMAQGAPMEIRDAQMNVLRFRRDGQRNLLEIQTPNRRSIQFKYDTQSRITHAQDDQGKYADYQYNENGMLNDVTLSSGRQRHYSYEGSLMTQIEDENHRVLLRNSYKGGVLCQQDFGNGRAYSYSYKVSANKSYSDLVEVTLPDGTTTSIATGDSIPNYVKNPPR